MGEIKMPLFFYQTPIGKIGVEETAEKIAAVYWEGQEIPEGVDVWESPLLKKAGRELEEYFHGARYVFSVPLHLIGTPFMRDVWEALAEIPYGTTVTYRQIAERVGRPKAARAVGLACQRNPLPLFIPCHRVIGSNGKLTGYAGGLKIKKQLLSLEAETQGK